MKKAIRGNELLFQQVIGATVILLAVLLTSYVCVFTAIQRSIEQNCFDTLENATSEVTHQLLMTVEKDRQHLSTIANFIARQDDLKSDTVLTLLQCFDNEAMISRLNMLYPDDRVLAETGEFLDAAGVLSFAEESARGSHVSDKSVSLLHPGTAVIRVFVPVIQSGETAAMLYGTIELDRMAEMFQTNVYDGEVELYIVDVTSGDFLLDTWHTSLGNIDMLYERNLEDGADAGRIIADMKNQGSGHFALVSHIANQVFYLNYQPTGMNNWQTGLTVPMPVVMAQSAFPQRMTIVLTGVYAAAFILYTLWIMRCNRRFVNLFLDMPAGMCVLAPTENLEILMANKAFFEIMNICADRKHQRNVSFLRLLNEEPAQTVREQWATIRESPNVNFEYEMRIPLPDGTVRIVMASIFYDRNGSGRLTVNALDITDRKHMEEEIRLLEREYQIAVRMTKRHVVMYDIRRSLATQLPGVTNLFQLNACTENFPEALVNMGLIEQGTLPAFRAFFQEIWRGSAQGGAYVNMRPVGGDAFRCCRLEFVNLFDEEGTPIRAILAAYDATEQRERELAYKRICQSVNELPAAQCKAYECNLTHDVVESAQGEVFPTAVPIPCPNATLNMRKAIAKYVSAEHAAALGEFVNSERLVRLYKQGVQTDSMQFVLDYPPGASRWFNVHVQLIEDSFSGNVKAYYLFRDIDQQKRQEIQKTLDYDALKNELEESRIKVMINQMQPHFLYNALSAIQTIVKTDPDYAYQLIFDFTTHLRSSIKALSSDAPIPFRDELKNIRAYLNIEQMRFGDRLKVNYEIDCDDFYVVPLSIQPLAENAARHGVYPKGRAGGTVTIRSYETSEAYVVEVEDDGTGFDVGETLSRESDSVGLKNLIFRLKSLMHAQVVIDSAPGKGTRVVVTIPQ